MLKNLLEKRATLLARCKALQELAAKDNRDMTADEDKEFRSNITEIDKLDVRIKDLQDLEAREAKQKEDEEREKRAAAAQPPQQRPNTGGTRTAEVHDNREDAPFNTLAEQLTAIRVTSTSQRSLFDPRLRKFDLSDMQVRAAAGASEAIASDGGFLIQTDFAAPLEKATFEMSVLASRVSKINISSSANGVKIPYPDETSRATGSRWGGIRGYWLGEAEAPTASKPKFGLMELGLKKLGAVCHMTDELMSDAAAVVSYTTQAVSEELAFMLDDAIWQGAGGGGVPLGWLNAPATVTVSKTSTQANDTIIWENVSAMRRRMFARSVPNSVWFINQECIGELERMFVPHTNKAGTENVSGQSVWQPPRGAQDPPNGTLFGRPVIAIEQASAIGDLGDIMYVDPTMYLLAQKGGVQSASSIHVNFLTDQTAFRWMMRVDGQPKIKSAVTPYKGANSLSAFLKLEAR